MHLTHLGVFSNRFDTENLFEHLSQQGSAAMRFWSGAV